MNVITLIKNVICFVTDNYDIPTYFITKFLEENDCFVEQDDKVYVAFKEVVFKSNY